MLQKEYQEISGRSRKATPATKKLCAESSVSVPASAKGIFTDWKEAFLVIPLRYEDRRENDTVETFEEGRVLFTEGRVTDVQSKVTKNGRRMTIAHCLDQNGAVFRCSFFQFPEWLKKQVRTGTRWVFSGKGKRFGSVWVIAQPALKSPEEMGSIVPVYKKRGKYGTNKIHTAILDIHRYVPAELFETAFPQWQRDLLLQLGLPDVRAAFRKLHRPETLDEIEEARDTFKVLEASRLLESAQSADDVGNEESSEPLVLTARQEESLLAALPFSLNASQEKVWEELRCCLSQNRILRGLLLGGVGSGKSALAYLSALAVALGGDQRRVALLIAPTTILAEQLYRGILPMGEAMGIPVSRIDSSKNWQVPQEGAIWVGTHGTLNMIERLDAWDHVGLVVFDEEHRFGRGVKEVPATVHTLFMSATPIPGTLARLRFGDLTMFRLQSRPRQVETIVLPRSKSKDALLALEEAVASGSKAMVIYGTIQRDPLPPIEDEAAIQSSSWGDDTVTIVQGQFTPAEALAEAALLPDGSRRKFYRVSESTELGEIVAQAQKERGMFAFPVLLYDKESPEKLSKIEVDDLKKGSVYNGKELLKRMRNEQYASIPLYRESAIREGKDMDSSLPFWESRFPGKCVVLTGAMKGPAKAQAIARYESGECPILITTTIVEVGVDIEGTDLVILSNGENLGIASLVQLRGRVGRHGKAGKCIIMGPDDSDSLERLYQFAQENDDEKLATMDFYERGFGDLKSKVQSGNTGSLFRLPRDRELLGRILAVWEKKGSGLRAA